jgi:PKD repeat protein
MSFCIFYLSWSCEEKGSGPIANFTIQNDGCKAPCTISFNNTSQYASSYQWDFGDGNNSTDQNPSHEYIESGEYNVILTATGPGGNDNHSLKVSITSDPVVINGIFPNSNPVGGPVLIEGEGFTDKTDVYFNNVEATIEERSPTFLTTKVPAGLGATTVTVRIETGIMFDEEPFDVLSAFPSDLPSSPPNIIIPLGGITSPISFTTSEIDFITVMNVYDTTHRVNLIFGINSDDPEILSSVSKEIIFLNGNTYSSPVTFDGSPIYDFSDRDNPEVSKMEVNRSASDPSNHPYNDDELSGKFVTIEDFEFPTEVLQFTQAELTDNFLLLTSNETGRQYLFVVLCYPDFEGACN